MSKPHLFIVEAVELADQYSSREHPDAKIRVQAYGPFDSHLTFTCPRKDMPELGDELHVVIRPKEG